MRISVLQTFLTALVCALALQAASPAGMNEDELKRIPTNLQRFIDDGTVAGVVSLVARHGQIVEFEAQGMADIEAQRPMKKDTTFQIMSMTKPVTAIAIMMLVEEGKLALRDPVEQYLPEFRNQKVVANIGPDNARLSLPDRPITVRDLMTHTAGIQDPAPAEIRQYPQLMNISLAQVVESLARQPLLFQPGSHWSYSSPGIEILGRIVEVRSGQKYEDFVAERILKPLGMKNSFFFPTDDQTAHIAMVYSHRDKKLVRAANTILGGDPAKYRKGAIFPAPGWGLYSTAEDLLHLYQMMLNGGSYQGRRFLSPFSVKLMTEVHTGRLSPVGWMGGTGYGLAWEVVDDPFGELVGHTKGTYGHGGAFGTQGWIDPSNDLIRILLLQNSDGTTTTLQSEFMLMAEAAVEK